jgi:hypothetical protein
MIPASTHASTTTYDGEVEEESTSSDAPETLD